MFIGHYAPAFLAASSPRNPRLGQMFVAAQCVDLAFFTFVLLGVENMREVPGFTVMNPMDLYFMPYTHSLAGSLGFAALWAVGARLTGRNWRGAWIGAAVVASHWFLDLLVHAPDLTIAGAGPRYGFALWNRPQIAMPLELGIIALTATCYATRTRATNWRGTVSLALLLLTLLAVQMVNWLTPQPLATIDPVPVDIPLTALAAYAILATLAVWTGQTRKPRGGPSVTSL